MSGESKENNEEVEMYFWGHVGWGGRIRERWQKTLNLLFPYIPMAIRKETTVFQCSFCTILFNMSYLGDRL